MTNLIATALQAAPAPSADALAAPATDAPAASGDAGRRERAAGFASVLDDHVARTAVAEGQNKSAGGSAPAKTNAISRPPTPRRRWPRPWPPR